MKQFILILPFFLILFSCTRVDPDKEGVLITNWGKDYPQDYKVVTGRVNDLGPATELLEIPMAEQKGDIEPFEVIAKDGGIFIVDPEYSFGAIRGTGPKMAFKYLSYRSSRDFLISIADNVLEPRMKNWYKEAAGYYSTDSLMNNRVAYERQVEDSIRLDFEVAHFELRALASGVKPPESMQNAIEQRNTAIQEAEQKKNQLETAKADQAIRISEAKADLEVAKLEAEANKLRAKSLTPNILSEMWINKWNGVLPSTQAGELPMMFSPGK